MGLIILLVVIDVYVAWIGGRKIYDKISDLPNAQAVLVLGASVYSNGQMGNILRDRAVTALEIYNAGKARKIIVSGYRTDNYDEVEAVKNFF